MNHAKWVSPFWVLSVARHWVGRGGIIGLDPRRDFCRSGTVKNNIRKSEIMFPVYSFIFLSR